MANDYISVNRGTIHGGRLVSLAVMLQEVRAGLLAEIGAANHMFETGDFTTLEEKFGLEAGTGGSVLTLLTLINDILNMNTEVAGPARLSQINEFTARLGGG